MTLQLLVNGVDFTSAWRPYESRWATRAWQGESVQSEFLIDDPAGSFVHADFAARKIVEVWENASGSNICMYRGRIANKTLGPGMFHAPGHAFRWTLFTEDFNIDLRGIRVINADRPEESNYDRAEVIRQAYLNGAASTHPQARDSTDLDGGSYLGPTPADAVTLEAEVYEDTDPVGVLAQMTEQDGHLFFVYLQNDGVGALAYMKITDEAILSNISIVDDGHDEGADGVDIYAAAWDVAGDHGGQNVLTGAGIRYGDGSYAEESDVSGYEAIYDKWETTFSNDLIYYEVTAEAYVNTVVAANDEVHTYFATIEVPARYVHRIKAGMMVPLIRKRANKLGNATARAVNVTYEPQTLEDGHQPIYRVTLELGRPRFLRTIPPKRRKIPRPPTQPTADACTRWYFSINGAAFNPAASGSWDTDSAGANYENNLLKTTADGTYAGTGSGSTSSGGTSSNDIRLGEFIIAINADTATVLADGGAEVTAALRARSRSGIGISEAAQDNISQMTLRVFDSGGSLRGTALAAHSLSSSTGSNKWRANTTHQNRTFPPAAATNVLTAVPGTVAGDYMVVELGYRSFTVGTTGGAIQFTNAASSDLPAHDETETSNLNSWIQICTTGSSGDTPEDVGGGGSGSPGTSTQYAPIDHVHEHGELSDDGNHHHDEAQIEGTDDYVEAVRTDSDTPGVNDDEDDGYRTGDIWVDRTANEAYILTDGTAGAAVWEQFVPSSGSVSDLDDLGDVVITTPTDGDVLTYDSGAGDWVNEAPTSGATSFVSIAKWGND